MIVPTTRRGAVIDIACQSLGVVTVPAGGLYTPIVGPGVWQRLQLSWAGGAVHWIVYDGIDDTGIPMFDESFTSTSINSSSWTVSPSTFTAGLTFKNASAVATMQVMLRAAAGLNVAASGLVGPIAASTLLADRLCLARAFLAIPAGTGKLVRTGPCVLRQLLMRPTGGGPPAITVRAFDGVDTSGRLYDLNDQLTTSANGFDSWVDTARMATGFFLQNDGPTRSVDINLCVVQ